MVTRDRESWLIRKDVYGNRLLPTLPGKKGEYALYEVTGLGEEV